MKNKLYLAFCVVSLILCVAISKYDISGSFWWVNLVIFLGGTYLILRDFKPELNKEIEHLKNQGTTSDFIASFLLSAVAIAVIVGMFYIGYTGNFSSDLGYMGDTFMSCIFSAALVVFGCFMLAAILTFVLFVPLGAFVSWISDYSSQFPMLLFINGCAFIILSYICGLVDIWKIVKTVSYIFDVLFK